eukprot:scaffold163741_cov31-Tisochrysis_lutea.AAC.1
MPGTTSRSELTMWTSSRPDLKSAGKAEGVGHVPRGRQRIGHSDPLRRKRLHRDGGSRRGERGAQGHVERVRRGDECGEQTEGTEHGGSLRLSLLLPLWRGFKASRTSLQV